MAKRLGTIKEMQRLMASSEGFTRVGEGCYREVFLSEMGDVVYKMEPICGEYVSNNIEHSMSERLQELASDLIVIPRTRKFAGDQWTSVLAMEYIGGRELLMVSCAERAENVEAMRELFSLPIADLHDGNVKLLDDGRIAVIDLGGGDSEPLGEFSNHRLLAGCILSGQIDKYCEC